MQQAMAAPCAWMAQCRHWAIHMLHNLAVGEPSAGKQIVLAGSVPAPTRCLASREPGHPFSRCNDAAAASQQRSQLITTTGCIPRLFDMLDEPPERALRDMRYN